VLLGLQGSLVGLLPVDGSFYLELVLLKDGLENGQLKGVIIRNQAFVLEVLNFFLFFDNLSNMKVINSITTFRKLLLLFASGSLNVSSAGFWLLLLSRVDKEFAQLLGYLSEFGSVLVV
jgi:hypothetical protein